ncbi:hypothetical protein [Streptomyces lutosisoli]|uniref:hypothetical protein n=1 Tax=Streptomyces lutosisoli TaxID=2665721 RepID=UPI00360FA536
MRRPLSRGRTARRGLRLWPVGTVLLLTFTSAVLVAAAVFYAGWDLLGTGLAMGQGPRYRPRRPTATLKAELGSAARYQEVNCLDACERANVIGVQPFPAGRAAGGRPV